MEVTSGGGVRVDRPDDTATKLGLEIKLLCELISVRFACERGAESGTGPPGSADCVRGCVG